jgi:hypothetical protein
MAVFNLITDFIKANEFRFYKVDNPVFPLYATKPFDGYSAAVTQLPWMLQNTFTHKRLFNDTCTVYVQTQANTIGTPTPYPALDLIDVRGDVVTSLSTAPFTRGAQQISGNTIYNPQTGTNVQANTYCWEFRFELLLTAATDSGIYYLRLTNLASDGVTNVQYITEPILVFGGDASTIYPNTVVVTGYNNSNNNYMGYIRSGWDNPDYFPVFRHRIEGYLTEFEPKSIYIGMLEQEYQPYKILAQNYRSWKFELGGSASNGVPDFMHEKINEIMSMDYFSIDGKQYERDITDTDAGVKNLWQTVKNQSSNRRFPATMLREPKNTDYIFFDRVENPIEDLLVLEPTGFPYAICPFYLDNGSAIFPFDATIVEDSSAQSSLVATWNLISGIGGTFYETGGNVYFNPDTGTATIYGDPVLLLYDYFTAIYSGSAVGGSNGFRYIGTLSRMVVDWGDGTDADYLSPSLPSTPVNVSHGFAATGDPTYSSRVFHNNECRNIIWQEAGGAYPVLDVFILDHSGDFPSNLRTFSVLIANQYGGVASAIDFSNCANNITSIGIQTCLNYVYNPGFLNVSMPNLIEVSVQGCKLTVSDVDNLFNDMVTNSWNGILASGNINTQFQTPAAPPTAASLTSRNALIAKSWTLTTD